MLSHSLSSTYQQIEEWQSCGERYSSPAGSIFNHMHGLADHEHKPLVRVPGALQNSNVTNFGPYNKLDIIALYACG